MLSFYYSFLFSNVALGVLGSWEGYLPGKKTLLDRDVELTCSCTNPLAVEWVVNKSFLDAVISAVTLAGYNEGLNNRQTWSSEDGFLGHTTIDEYDSRICAAIVTVLTSATLFRSTSRSKLVDQLRQSNVPFLPVRLPSAPQIAPML